MKFFILFNLLFYFNLCNSSNLLIECDTIGLQKDTLILIDTKVGCIDKILNANNNKNITLHIINEDLYYNELFKGINNIKSLEIFLIDGKLHFNTRDTFLFQKLEQVVLSFNTNFLPRGLLLSPNLRVFMFTDNKCNNNYNSDLNLIFKNLALHEIGFKLNSKCLNLKSIKVEDSKITNTKLIFLGIDINLSISNNLNILTKKFPNIEVLSVSTINSINDIPKLYKFKRLKKFHLEGKYVSKRMIHELSKIKNFEVFVDYKKIN